MIVVTENVAGNLHAAAAWCNKYRLGRFLRQMDCSGNYTIVVLVMTDDEHRVYQKGMSQRANILWTMDTPP